MKDTLKQQLIANGCAEHVDEFGGCVGAVEGLTEYGLVSGPEVDVRWQPSGLRYAYHPDDLEVVGATDEMVR